MKKKHLAIGAVVAVVLALCAAWLFWPEPEVDPDEERYSKHVFHDEQVIYVDDSAILEQGALTPNQKKLEERTLFLEMERLYETYQHYTTFAEGMSSKQPGLTDEMNARYATLYAEIDGPLVSAGSGEERFYVTFHDIDVQDDVAKVVCSYRIQHPHSDKPELEESEVIFWVMGQKDWVYSNIISTAGGIDNAVFEALCESDTPDDWDTTYAFTTLKRSSYANDGKNYTDYDVWKERVAATAPETIAEKTEAQPNQDLDALATHIADTRTEDGTYVLMGTEKSREAFTPEKLQYHVQMGLEEENLAQRFKFSNMGKIRTLLADVNSTYFASLYSGEWRLVPRDCFVSDGIYEEANARTLVELFAQPNLGVNVSSAYFNLDIDKVRIRGDWAMAVVSRNENVGYIGNVQPQLYKNVVEAYILQKIDGDWRIENIIFSNGAPTDAIRTLIGPETSRADWEKDYCFKALRRADDLGEKNYSDYIQGNIEAPVLVME